MKLMSIDQSLSHCAVVIWQDGKVIDRHMIKTGSTSSKGKRKPDVVYFNTVLEQIFHIVCEICGLAKKHKIDDCVMESLSLGSVGNATRDLAGLFYCIQSSLWEHYISLENLHVVAPTSVKAFARSLLPEEERVVVKEKVDKKTGKKVYSKGPVKMEKSHMVRAVDCDYPGWLDGLTLAAGKADYADAYLIGKKFLEDLSAGKE